MKEKRKENGFCVNPERRIYRINSPKRQVEIKCALVALERKRKNAVGADTKYYSRQPCDSETSEDRKRRFDGIK